MFSALFWVVASNYPPEVIDITLYSVREGRSPAYPHQPGVMGVLVCYSRPAGVPAWPPTPARRRGGDSGPDALPSILMLIAAVLTRPGRPFLPRGSQMQQMLCLDNSSRDCRCFIIFLRWFFPLSLRTSFCSVEKCELHWNFLMNILASYILMRSYSMVSVVWVVT